MPHRIVIVTTCALVAFVLVVGMFGPTESQARGASNEWELTGLRGPILSLMTPLAGAFFAVQGDPDNPNQSSVGTFWRSDDAGDTWQEIGVPLATRRLVIDPTDNATLLTTGWRLSKSTDGGASWTRLVADNLPEIRDLSHPEQIVVSPADHQRLFMAIYRDSTWRMLRSSDGGFTWEEATRVSWGADGCYATTNALLAHPSDPARLLRADACYFLGAEAPPVAVSEDNGSTWTGRGTPSVPGRHTAIDRLVGWQGAMPERLYVTTIHAEASPSGGSNIVRGRSVFRSDDEGQSWTLLLTTYRADAAEKYPSITGLAYDPARPDVVYVASQTGVRVSSDAGQSWSDLGRQNLPRVSGIALGIDQRNLYAATEGGLFRLRLVD
jgi:photosystem II stability/assembly factor-like uncharacterized protein